MAIGPARQPRTEPTLPVQLELAGRDAETISVSADQSTRVATSASTSSKSLASINSPISLAAAQHRSRP